MYVTQLKGYDQEELALTVEINHEFPDWKAWKQFIKGYNRSFRRSTTRKMRKGIRLVVVTSKGRELSLKCSREDFEMYNLAGGG